MIVVAELLDGEPFCPICLAIIDVDPEVRLNLLVEPLCLSVCLRVAGGRGIVLDAQELAELGHSEYVVPEESGRLESGNVSRSRNRIHSFGEGVDDDKDGIVRSRSRKLSNEVHGEDLARPCRDLVRREREPRGSMKRLGPLAGGTTLDVSVDISSHSGPLVIASDELKSLGLSGVSSETSVRT